MKYENNTTQEIQSLIYLLQNKISDLNYYLDMGDYTESEYLPMKNDIKKYKSLIKDLEKVKEKAYLLEIAL